MIVARADQTPSKCEVFKVCAQGGLILDVDISGLPSRGKLEEVLQKQRGAFFSAGELQHSSHFFGHMSHMGAAAHVPVPKPTI